MDHETWRLSGLFKCKQSARHSVNLTSTPKLENILLVYDLADNSCVLRGYVVVYTGTDIGVVSS